MSGMSYTGRVRPGGRPDVRELADLVITKLSVSEMDNNVYLLRCRRTDDQLLVDAADEAPRILQVVGADGLRTVVTTPQHWDHHRALPEVVAATGAVTVAGALDADALPVPVSRPVSDGDVVEVGTCSLEVVHLAGHTPGSIALLYDDPDGSPHLFTGDSLFPGGPGRTTTPQDFASLMDDLESKVFGRLPDETWFYPGHGDDSTLGEHRRSLPEWRAGGWSPTVRESPRRVQSGHMADVGVDEALPSYHGKDPADLRPGGGVRLRWRCARRQRAAGPDAGRARTRRAHRRRGPGRP